MEARVPRFEPVAEMRREVHGKHVVTEPRELAREISGIIHEWDANPTEERYLVAHCDDATQALRIYQTVRNVCVSRACRDTDYVYDGRKRGNEVYIERKRKREYKWV